jgi:hypothetical protein
MVMLTFWRALKDGDATEKLHDGGPATASEMKDGEATEELNAGGPASASELKEEAAKRSTLSLGCGSPKMQFGSQWPSRLVS